MVSGDIDDNVLDSGTISVEHTLSDHKGTFIYLKSGAIQNQSYERKIWAYQNADFDKLNSLINDTNWNTLINNAIDIDQAEENFTSTLLKHVKQCIPEKTIIIRPKDKPWFDSALRKTIRQRNRARQKAHKTKNMLDLDKFKKLRNKVNNMKKIAMANYYNNIETSLIDASAKNSKLYWKLLKDIFKTKTKTEIPPLQESNDHGVARIIYNDTDKVEALNNYFVYVSSLLDNEPTLPDFRLLCNDILDNIVIGEQDIIDIISILPVNKAIGPDNISHKMLKATIFSIAYPLKLLFNRSLNDCSFPKCWKLANVLPLFKKGDPSVLSNYRPVSLLSCVGKIMERVVFKYVYNYFHSNRLFYKYQAGFLPGHSTVYQLLETYDSLAKAIDEGKHCCMIFCDLSKAFDRVWHKGLLFKLQSYGVGKNLLQWFESYMSFRTQRVLHKNTMSKIDV